ncbi:hypothetical protein BGZ82_006910 [Podila clonocystis]|nr:hypothetical protein BGZ82_006910 [Podila clonocystis]
MPDYYDSWSANKRKKNISRRSVHASLDQHGTEHVPNQHPASVTPSIPARSATPTSSSPLSPTRARFSLTKFSPALPRAWGRSDVERGSPTQGHSGMTWRSNTHPAAVDNVAHDAFDKDFDDDDDEDEDDEYDDNNDLHALHAIKQHNILNPRSRHAHVEHEGIEQLVGDEFLAPNSDLPPMTKSSPALPMFNSSTDNPHSTSTSARIHPQPNIRVQDTTRGKEGRKQRPWSQVIWESPIMDESIAPRQRVYDHAATVGGKYDNYPALTKDLFTQRTPDNRTVRINIDAPDTPPIIPRRPVRTPERSSQGATLLPVPATGRREFSHSSKHAHRLSIGSGFYATLEPVNLAAATPTTPKAKCQLVRLPARPQSVFIPITSIHKQGALQVEDATRRRRHQSQQLEMGRPVVPMSAQDNARTFNGIGTGPSVENALAPFETSTSCSALEGTTPTEACKSDTLPVQPSQRFQPQQRTPQHPNPAFHTPASALMTSVQVTPTQTQQQRGSSHPVQNPPSRFLPTLMESPSSFFFKKPFSSSSSSSPSSSSAGSPSLPTQEPWARSSPSPDTTKSYYSHTLQASTTTPSRTRRTMTPSLAPEKHSPYHHRNHVSSSSNSTSWKKSPSALFPFSLVSYESGGLLGIKNTNTVCSTNAASPIVAPGTILPPGTIVSTGVPVLAPTSFPTPPNMPTISLTPSCGSIERFPGSSASSPSGEGATAEILLEKDRFGEQTGFQGTLPYDHYAYQHVGIASSEPLSSPATSFPEYLLLEDGSEVLVQKSHVAVYEINARWGSRLAMVLVSLGGLLCAVSGGLCAEHNCRELQFCEDGHAAHGNWCGPSGVDGAPYMLTVGLSMWTFGLYALSHLRTPTSRLVGYSEIDQFH